MIAVAMSNVGVGIVDISTSQRVSAWVLREVLQEDRRLQLLHFYLRKLEGSLVGHDGGQGVGPFQEVVHLAKQASSPLVASRRRTRARSGSENWCGGGCFLGTSPVKPEEDGWYREIRGGKT